MRRVCGSLMLALAMLAAFVGAAQAQNPARALTTCVGRFPNPITDVCWSCMFPITFAGADLKKLKIAGQVASGYIGIDEVPGDTPPNPICECPAPPPVFVRFGVTTGLWEPVRQVDVTRKPFCLVGLGGINLGSVADAVTFLPIPEHGRHSNANGGSSATFYQAHWYISPLVYLLQLVVDFACVESSGFDLAYMTEFDPTWDDEELTSILNPEAVLFTNIFVQASCAIDCVASSFIFPIEAMPWCAGCNGPTFPLNGWVQAHIGGAQSAALITQRLHHKLQREGVEWMYHTAAAMCGPIPQPLIIDKIAIKTQLAFPIPQTSKFPFCCNWLGGTGLLSYLGVEIPVAGEDFVFNIFRKRVCCAL